MYEKPKRKKTKSNASPPKTQERESCYNFDEEQDEILGIENYWITAFKNCPQLYIYLDQHSD